MKKSTIDKLEHAFNEQMKKMGNKDLPDAINNTRLLFKEIKRLKLLNTKKTKKINDLLLQLADANNEVCDYQQRLRTATHSLESMTSTFEKRKKTVHDLYQKLKSHEFAHTFTIDCLKRENANLTNMLSSIISRTEIKERIWSEPTYFHKQLYHQNGSNGGDINFTSYAERRERKEEEYRPVINSISDLVSEAHIDSVLSDDIDEPTF